MSDKEVVEQPKTRKRGIRGFARKKVALKDSGVSGIYSQTVEKCFSKLTEIKKVVVQVDGFDVDVEDDLGARFKEAHQDDLGIREPEEPCFNISDDEDLCSDEKRAADVRNVNTSVSKSPSPPPPPSPSKSSKAKKKPRATKQRKNLLQAVDNFTQSSSEVQSDLLISNTMHAVEPDMIMVDRKDELTIRLDLRGNIQRYTLSSTEPFSTIVSEIARAEGVNEKQVMLVHNDNTVNHSNTPASVGLSLADIIECHIVQSCDDSLNDSHVVEDGLIELVLQSGSSKHRELVKAHKDKPLSVVMETYCCRLKKKQSSLQLMFDGEEISLDDTPDMLDMEDGDIIDVTEVQLTDTRSKTSRMYTNDDVIVI